MQASTEKEVGWTRSNAGVSGISRRNFMGRLGLAGLALSGGWGLRGDTPPVNPLPRWRGFNLTNFFQAFSTGERGQGLVSEDDLRWIRDWGFDFVRLPMDYWFWIDSDWKQTRKLELLFGSVASVVTPPQTEFTIGL